MESKSPAIFGRIAIIGLGLIGSSLARALSARKLAAHIAAFDNHDHAIEYGLKSGFIQSGHKSASEAAANADLIIFSTPPFTFSKIARDIAPFIKEGAIITDVGSVKRTAISAIKPYIPEHSYYVPSHPIAGSEKTGAEAGNSELFTGKKVVLTPEESELGNAYVVSIRILWEKIGAKVEFMPAFLHDLIYAYISHLPQIVAFAVAPLIDRSLSDEKYQRFTRLTKSAPELWTGICTENADCIGSALDDFIRFLTQIHGELRENLQDNNSDSEEPVLFAGLIAACLIATASILQEQTGVNPVRYAGTGFADMTASSVTDPQELLERISNNSNKIEPVLAKTLKRLQLIRAALAVGNKDKLIELFH